MITVRIRPRGAPGTVVRGDLFIDDFAAAVPPYGQTAGDELSRDPVHLQDQVMNQPMCRYISARASN